MKIPKISLIEWALSATSIAINALSSYLVWFYIISPYFKINSPTLHAHIYIGLIIYAFSRPRWDEIVHKKEISVDERERGDAYILIKSFFHLVVVGFFILLYHFSQIWNL